MIPPTVPGLDFTQKEIEQARKENKLLSIDLEFSRDCNLNCIYCYASAGKPLEKELTLEEIKDVIDQSIELGAKTFSLIGGGEPLIYNNLFKVIDYIKAKNKKCIVFTNGTLITKEIANKLFNEKISIVVKLNSIEPSVQDFLAGKEGTFKKIQQGITNLMNAGYPDKETKLGMQTIICKQNKEEIKQLWVWARKNKIIPYFEILTYQGRLLKNQDLILSKEELEKIFKQINKIDEKEFKYEWIPKPPLMSYSCQRNKYSIHIKSNGDIQPCVGIEITLGNIRKNKIKEILKHETIFKLRNIEKYIKGKCSTCKYNNACYGCRGNVFNKTEDYLEEDDLCWINEKLEG